MSREIELQIEIESLKAKVTLLQEKADKYDRLKTLLREILKLK